MAKTKAELQSDHDRHAAAMARAKKELAEGHTQEAVTLAASALEFVDGMMQYLRRFEKRADISTVDSIELILKYAPLLLDHSSLNKVGELLNAQRRVEKNTTADLGLKLENARDLMWNAHRLWAAIQARQPISEREISERFEGSPKMWRYIVEAWEKMGVIRSVPRQGTDLLSLATNMDEVIYGKCPSCGARRSAPKFELLQQLPCANCGDNVCFVLMPAPRASA